MAPRWTIEVRHDGLGKYRVVSGPDKYIVEQKARAQRAEWERRYQQILEKGRKQQEQLETRAKQEHERHELEEQQEEAAQRTAEAEDVLQATRTILQSGLKAKCLIDWDVLLKDESFRKSKPAPPIYAEYPHEPQLADTKYQPKLCSDVRPNGHPIYLAYPAEPERSSNKYQPDLSLLDKLVKSRIEQKVQAAEQLYIADFNEWQEACQRVEIKNQQIANEMFANDYAKWAESVETIKAQNDNKYNENVVALEQWDREWRQHEDESVKRVAALTELKTKYEALDSVGIEDYCEMVLASSNYPDNFPQDFELEYNSETKILIVDYSLPAPENMPRLKEVKHIKSKNDFKEIFLSDSELNNLYDDVLYQICLRSLHELFMADGIKALAAVSFNGWVKSINKATGNEVNDCILTVLAKADEFGTINLESVDPKACFKNLKGVGSSKLHGLTPVAPVLSISREDKRFIAPREVVEKLAEGENLAAMDWEDFEHLIRELFEEEFKAAGGEVKITQASHDNGVDAVAFDPDVIRGGKTVIQAKRYTNTVPVSAVRDLYGTVLNEGASKGILVTTSDYGPESYEFAKEKPLVLLNGSNLLNLLEKHGHKAKIDLKEAKKIIAELEKARNSG